MSIPGIYYQLFSQPAYEFGHHLDISDNERIIFSGQFGMGKTTFLDWYFNIEENKKKYNVIHLFPVNYSVASNEDIFRYIKYDIILEMLRNNYEISADQIKASDVFKTFMKKNFDKVATAIVNMIPKIGKEIVDVYDRLKTLIDTYDELEKQMKEDNAGDRLANYLGKIKNVEGTIFEDDIITKTIEVVLKDKKSSSKENVLVIDDLDRIDPEHIFRLLNIFAAHFDRRNIDARNKFGFDKVIFVCDIQNVREIFKAKFGLNVDFNGYIDKFFSNTIFEFNHEKNYKDFIFLYLQNINLLERGYENPKKIVKNRRNFISLFLDICIDNKLFDLRSIVKWHNKHFTYKTDFKISDEHFYIERYDAAICLKFLKDIQGSSFGFHEAIDKLCSKQLKINNNNLIILCAEIIKLIDCNKIRVNEPLPYILNGKHVLLNYSYNYDRFEFHSIRAADNDQEQAKLADSDFKNLLKQAIEFMDLHNILSY